MADEAVLRIQISEAAAGGAGTGAPGGGGGSALLGAARTGGAGGTPRDLLEVEAKAALIATRKRRAADDKDAASALAFAKDRMASIAVEEKQRREQETRQEQLLGLEAQAALDVARKQHETADMAERRQEELLDVEARAALEVAQKKNTLEDAREAREKDLLEIEAKAALEVARKKVEAEEAREARQKELLEIEARAALNVARRQQKDEELNTQLNAAKKIAIRAMVGAAVGGEWGKLLAIPRPTETWELAGGKAGGGGGAGLAGMLTGAIGVIGAGKAQGVPGAAAALAGQQIAKQFSEALNKTITGIGGALTGAISPSADPAQFMKSMGDSAMSAGKALMAISPPAGLVVGAFGAVQTAAGGLMQAFDGMVQRYGQYNAGITLAQARAEARQTFGDIARAQQAAPDLISYIERRSDLQQRIEEFKLDFMRKILPLVENGMEALQNAMPLISTILDVLSLAFRGIQAIQSLIGLGRKDDADRKAKELQAWMDSIDPTAAIQRGYVEPGSPEEARRGPRVQVPRV